MWRKAILGWEEEEIVEVGEVKREGGGRGGGAVVGGIGVAVAVGRAWKFWPEEVCEWARGG